MKDSCLSNSNNFNDRNEIIYTLETQIIFITGFVLSILANLSANDP